MISLQAQASEVELHFLGLRDLVTRASSGKIKRGPEEIERLRSRCEIAKAAACTLNTIAERQKARMEASSSEVAQ